MRINLFYFFLLLSTSAIGQNIDIDWTFKQKSPFSLTNIGYVGSIGESFYTLRTGNRAMYLSKTKEGQESKEWTRTIPWMTVKPLHISSRLVEYFSFEKVDNYFLAFFEGLDTVDNVHRLFTQKIDFEANLIGRPVELANRPNLREAKEGNFHIDFSPNRTSFVITTNPSDGRKINEKFIFALFDNQLKPISSREVDMPVADENYVMKEVRLARSGDIYFLARVRVSSGDRVEYHREIVNVNAISGAVTRLDVDIEGKHFSAGTIRIDCNDQLRLFEFYSDSDSKGGVKNGINGLLCETIAGGFINKISSIPFNEKMQMELAGTTRTEQGLGLHNYFDFQHIYEKPDGGFLLISEDQYYTVMQTRRSHFYRYYRNSILVLNLENDGSLQWYASIKKSQMTANDIRYLSYYSFYHNGIATLIYNSDSRNVVGSPEIKAMRRPRKSIPIVVTIDPAGHINKQILSTKIPEGFILMPAYGRRMSQAKALFEVSRSRRFPFDGLSTKESVFGIATIAHGN